MMGHQINPKAISVIPFMRLSRRRSVADRVRPKSDEAMENIFD
ncbi:hypothetical protein ISN45_At02g018460 [Arabidopsis thaliana x Arabidopsis arenosa]|uniref:Uncharacterized protein n=1 Tax=Arabidopsis thaliana x Arabidopsis arenosa TaxID=1240361 RepID=A0A8T2FMC8_9BRAS|nr:hypothetical protein ISN45_At02g018460 [Arabidopsis thaliana x Arabidopsis arenosa]